MSKPRFVLLAGAVAASVVLGCSSPDERLVQVSERSVARQAEQNQQIARQSQEVSQATHDLVQADAKARAELVAAPRSLQESLQTERSRLDQQRDKLEQDRQALVAANVREPIIANAISGAALLLAVLLPLMLCIYLLRSFGPSEPSHALNDWLIDELTSEQSPLLSAPQTSLPRPDRTATGANDVSAGSPA